MEIEIRITEMERVQRFVPLGINGISEEKKKLEIGKEALVDKNNQTIFSSSPPQLILSNYPKTNFIIFPS